MTLPITLGMIVRNEARFLPRALATLVPHVAEIVVVDDASTDRSARIAARFGARVVRHASGGDLVGARNRYVEAATQPWILSIDADERIAEQDVPRLRRLIARADADAWQLPVRNYGDELNLLRDWHRCRGDYPAEERFAGTHGWSRTQPVRLFRRDARFRYVPPNPHTTIGDSIRAHGGVIRMASIPIHHFQCLKGRRVWRRKQRSYAQVALRAVRQHRGSARLHLDLGQELFSLGGRDAEAIRHLRRAAALRPDWSEPHRFLGMVYQTRGRTDAALDHLRAALRLEPGNADLHCLIGRCQLIAGRYDDALASLREALAQRREHPIAAHLLGVAYESLGNRRRALLAYRRAVKILPVYSPAAADLRRLERATASIRSA